MTKSSDGPEWGEDVAPETLADTDSKFVDVGGVRVHYKEALPLNHHQGAAGRGSSGSIGSCSSGSSCAERGGSSGIVLIHGFGGGVVSWRHLLEPLARHTGLRVVAYDRPAFGLTSRPVPASDQGNPYTMESQAALVLDLCCQLGLQDVILAGHADGCLLAMKANSLLASERAAASVSSSCSAAAITTRPSDTPTPTFRPPSPTLSRDNTQAAAVPAAWPPTGSPSTSPFTASNAAMCAGSAAGAPPAAAAPGTEGGPAAASGRIPQRGRRQSAGRHTPSSSDHSRTVSSEGEQQLYDAASQFGSMGSSSGLCPPFMSPCGSCSLSVQSAYHTPISTSTAANAPSQSYPLNPSASYTASLSPPPYAASAASANPSGLGMTSEGAHTAVCASAAADSCDSAGVGGAPGGSIGGAGTVMMRASSARHRKVAATGSSGQTPPQSPSLHAWSPNERPCRPLRVTALALMHPDLSGSLGPSMTRLLARSKLGRSILRPLLRSEIGEVANPRAWYNPEKLTPEVVELYKAPVEGWCEALIETTRLRSSSQKSDLSTCVSHARPLPALILTGLHDVIVPPARADELSASLPLSRVAVLAECGHLSHEEVPMALLQQLVMFCSQVCL
ncbi:Alpha/Beta hydrolase protein [Dunaliella salina]|nr:Alpha/Beta hydrolase protein [Dunaliella salina]|eukprot:KAF5832211.1 Alpha/Beta hydrolase protein [Dunaliella salina]